MSGAAPPWSDDCPDGICGNCFGRYRAARPRPQLLWCHHRRCLATLTAKGWKILRNVDSETIAAARAEGLL